MRWRMGGSRSVSSRSASGATRVPYQTTRTPPTWANRLFRNGNLTGNPLDEVGWGGRIIRPCGPHPFGADRGALTRVTARTNQPPQRDRQHWPLHRAPRPLSFPSWHSPRVTRERFLWLMPSYMAGVEGFEP